MPIWAPEAEAWLRSWLGLQMAIILEQAIDLSEPVPPKYIPEAIMLSPPGAAVRTECNRVSHVQTQKLALRRALKHS